MDGRDIPAVILAFFIIAILIVFVAVFSKAYKNWKVDDANRLGSQRC